MNNLLTFKKLNFVKIHTDANLLNRKQMRRTLPTLMVKQKMELELTKYYLGALLNYSQTY